MRLNPYLETRNHAYNMILLIIIVDIPASDAFCILLNDYRFSPKISGQSGDGSNTMSINRTKPSQPHLHLTYLENIMFIEAKYTFFAKLTNNSNG